MASVLVPEEMFSELLHTQAAATGASFFIRMGETRLVEGLGEVYSNPVVMCINPEATTSPEVAMETDVEEDLQCDCE